jgi:hypothetical protein
MFGQFAWFWVPPPVVPGVVVLGADEAPGEGLAALTIATPPAASRPIARSAEAMSRRESDSRGAGDGVAGVVRSVSFIEFPSGWLG